MLNTPVRCTIRPRALRVVVPKGRPGVPAPKAALEWPRLWQLASFRAQPGAVPLPDRIRRAGRTRPGTQRPGHQPGVRRTQRPVRDKIERYGLTRTIDPHHFFPTIESAIAAYRDKTGAQWTAGQPSADQAAAGRTDPAKTATDTG